MKNLSKIPSKISIIIPVYNAALYLEDCLTSIQNQTLKDIEIICVDDGSTDNSLDILKQFAVNDLRIKIIHQKNMGAGSARNNGIKNASGEFICFLDPDDKYLADDILEILYVNAVKNNVLICGGSFAFLRDNIVDSNLYGKGDFGYIFSHDQMVFYNDYQYDYGFHRFIYSRNFLIENDLFFPDFRRFQDPPFFVKAMLKAEKFYALSKITYFLRIQHKKVIWTKQKQLDLLYGIQENLKFADANNLDKLYYLTVLRLNQHIEVFDFIKNKFYLKPYLLLRSINKSIDYKKVKKIDPEYRSKFDNLILRTLVQLIFSVKNDFNKKIITILGIKIVRPIVNGSSGKVSG